MKQIILGVYGCIASGKSTVSHYLESKGWSYINQDVLNHQVLQEFPEELMQIFGSDIFEETVVSRKKIREKVFSDSLLLKQLVEFSYPIIIQKTRDLINNTNHYVIEGAFFYQIKDSLPYTHLLYVETEPMIMQKRLIHKGYSLELINKILANQQDIFDHAYLSDYIIRNNNDLNHCYEQVELILHNLFKNLS